MRHNDFKEDNTVMNALSAIAEKHKIDMGALVELTEFIAIRAEEAATKGVEFNEAFIEESILEYHNQAKAFYQRCADNEQARNLIAEMTYDSIKRGEYCISLYGNKLDSFFPNSGFYERKETLVFSGTGYMIGSEEEMKTYLERCVKQCQEAAQDKQISEKQRSVADDCLQSLKRCKVRLV